MLLEKATTFEELAEIALKTLEAMPQPIGMVSGPISTGGLGSKEENIEVFQKVINWLQDAGISIFDQMPFEKHMWRIIQTPYYKKENQLLEKFYLPIFESGFVKMMYFIPGWQSSVGAKWEHERVIRLGIEIILLEEIL